MQNPQQQGRGKRFQRNFAQSNYITAAWNWFMTLAGKAAEPVLTISVLYSCARLLPAVHLPVQADNTVFIAQMIALDVGGLSLGKMAKAARAANNEEGATLAGRVSIALITIMVANVVLSVLQTIIPGLSGQLVAVIEALLLVARAIMAVLYAHVIHSLKGTLDEQSLLPALPAIDITQAITDLQTRFEERLSEMASEQARMIADLSARQEQAQNLLQIEQQRLLAGLQNQEKASPEIDYQELAKAIMPQLRGNIEGHVKAIWEEISVVPEPGQLEVRARSQKARKTALEPVKRPSLGPVARANGNPEERLQAAYELLLKNSIRVSGRALAREARTSRDTANKWLSEVLGQSEEPAIEGQLVPTLEPEK